MNSDNLDLDALLSQGSSGLFPQSQSQFQHGSSANSIDYSALGQSSSSFAPVSFQMPSFLAGGPSAEYPGVQHVGQPLEAGSSDVKIRQLQNNAEDFHTSKAAGQESTPQPSFGLPMQLGPIHPGGGNTNSNFPGLYSSTGFDMVGILARIAARPNPQINVGPVDMSCSFVVVDARKYDFPIVYASTTFERLTGYTNSEIVGRNCRFLQAPDGHVALGSRRRYTDNNAVYHIKSHMISGKESQASLINYRKGGQPFINLVTVIPITWDSDDIAYFVGFQVDLVEQPNAILEKMKDGTYVVNYQLMNLPPYIPPSFAPDRADDYLQSDLSNSMPFPASPDVLDLIPGANGDAEVAKRLWNRMLLENSDDFIHVLSLKGIFLYCSPTSKKMLEYDSDDLVGKSLSTICHPSDIVPVMRELKEASNNSDIVNLVFRIRRKDSGYMWMEAQGKLYLEQGKGRKCVILTGRERTVYRVLWKELQGSGGVGLHEFWCKLSLDGLFLYSSPACEKVLGLPTEELVGSSVYQLVRSDRTTDITRALGQVRDGNTITIRHHIQNKKRQYVEVITTLYAGDVNRTGKPSFVVAQVKEAEPNKRRGSSVSPKDRPSPTVLQDGRSSSTSSSSDSGSGSNSGSNSGTSSDASTPMHMRNLADEHDGAENFFDELDTTRSTSWQYELHQMRLTNKRLREELDSLMSSKRKRKKRKHASSNKQCAHCNRKDSPEWRKGPDGSRSLCNACGLRFAKTLSGKTTPKSQ